MWTIDKVKEDLPDVRVLVKGKEYRGRVSGRRLDFPVVSVPEIGVHEEFSWAAICRAINDNYCLKF